MPAPRGDDAFMLIVSLQMSLCTLTAMKLGAVSIGLRAAHSPGLAHTDSAYSIFNTADGNKFRWVGDRSGALGPPGRLARLGLKHEGPCGARMR
jgi:hypothetical protein